MRLLNSQIWLYLCFQVWMVFFQPGMTLPPPFNIVPSPKSLLYQLQWFIQRVRGKKSNHCSLGRCCYDTKYDSQYDDDDVSYELVMTNLTQRYLTSRRKGGGAGSGGVSSSATAAPQGVADSDSGSWHMVGHVSMHFLFLFLFCLKVLFCNITCFNTTPFFPVRTQ